MRLEGVIQAAGLRWIDIVRLGLVQTAIGAVVVLATSTINRVMIVELALPSVVPGLLVGLHYAVQVLRPRWGFGSDMSGRATPWIAAGMTLLALGGFLAAVATAWISTSRAAGLTLAVAAFLTIGIGVGAAGTSLLVLLAKRTAPERRPAAATIVWVMMIAGLVVTSAVAGQFLDPYSPRRLVEVSAVVSILALLVALAAIAGIEGARAAPAAAPMQPASAGGHAAPAFWTALAGVWADPQARLFTIFVFVSMLVYRAGELALEPFAGIVFAHTPGQSSKLAALQHAGVLVGMVVVGAGSTMLGRRSAGLLRKWAVAGCLLSAVSMVGLAIGAMVGPAWPLRANVALLGVMNGAYAVAAIGSMMSLAGEGRGSQEGTRMGLWGAAQGIAFGLGGLAGAGIVDLVRLATGVPDLAYTTLFSVGALLFALSALLAWRVGQPQEPATARLPRRVAGGRLLPSDPTPEVR